MQGRFNMEYRLFTIVRYNYNYRDYNNGMVWYGMGGLLVPCFFLSFLPFLRHGSEQLSSPHLHSSLSLLAVATNCPTVHKDSDKINHGGGRAPPPPLLSSLPSPCVCVCVNLFTSPDSESKLWGKHHRTLRIFPLQKTAPMLRKLPCLKKVGHPFTPTHEALVCSPCIFERKSSPHPILHRPARKSTTLIFKIVGPFVRVHSGVM
jgi:hypothetical protein